MNSTMAVEPDIKSLKEALCAQQRILQKLYHELDVEREAAATAASEAMSMILRLQGEKAAVKMEAEQYKRLAEEKMNHAEESMEIFDEIMYHKEMEIASLDYQVQAYRYKLLSLGFDDLGVHEIKFPEYLLQRNESLAGETSSRTPPKRLTLANLKKGIIERDRSITEDPDMIAKIVEESLRNDEHNQNSYLGNKRECSSSMDIRSYLEQIQELDKVVEHIVGDQSLCSNTAKTSRCPSVPSKFNEFDHLQYSQRSSDDKLCSDTCSPSVCDVFEVPLIEETLCTDEGKSVFKDEGKLIFKDDEKKIKKLTSFPKLPVKSHNKDETDSGKKCLPLTHKHGKVVSLGDGTKVDCPLALIQPNMTTEIINGEHVEQERATSTEERSLRLLCEINEKLDLIQYEIRSRNTKVNEFSSNYELPMLQLREAMGDLWI
ncbi:hypothetical protein R6Q57_018948 [Mikania cordata]